MDRTKGITILKYFISVLIACCALAPNLCVGESIDTAVDDKIVIIKKDIAYLQVYNLNQVSIQDPGIVDLDEVEDNNIAIIAQQEGETAIFLWDELGKRTIIIRVIEQDLQHIRGTLGSRLDR